jgi:hypothetical protein
MDEVCVPWEPFKPQANRYMEVNVQYLGWATPHVSGSRAGNSIATIVTTRIGHNTPLEQLLIWKVLFRGARAYRSTSSECWHEPTPWPPVAARLQATSWQVATWEILNSRWLLTCLPQEIISEQHIRHFVLANSYDFIDIAARDWSSQLLAQANDVKWQEFNSRLHEHWRSVFG